jgi:hypothetical protein
MVLSIGSLIPAEKVKIGMRLNAGATILVTLTQIAGKYYENSTFDSNLLLPAAARILVTI